MSRFSPPGLRRWRLAVILLGLALLVWIPVEDTGLNVVLAFACGLALAATARYLLGGHARRWGNPPDPDGQSWAGRLAPWALTGAVAGLAVTPIAVLLMVFKIGLHAHVVPDFTIGQVVWTLQRTPVWGLGGVLLGIAAGLVYLARGQGGR